MPLEPAGAGPADLPQEPAARRGRVSRWWPVLSRLLFVAIAAEVGSVLLIFPWLDLWGQNYLSGVSAYWYSVWMNSYFRGAVSGLGAVNLYVSFLELARFFLPLSDTMKVSLRKKD